MANLYEGKMAAIYDAMYQTFIDYDDEYKLYNTIIQKNNCKNVLEIGSGTGNLSQRFKQANFEYTGLDFSQSMIDIAKKRNPDCEFINGDMRNFHLAKVFDSVIITGRSTSYLISNNDINNTFNSVFKNLVGNGIIAFDFIDANRFIPFIKKNENIIHQAEHEEITYFRESNWKTTESENFMLEWSARYYTQNNGVQHLLLNDFSTVRVFTLDEIQLFLELNGFQIIQTIDRKTYAYNTYVIVARKK